MWKTTESTRDGDADTNAPFKRHYVDTYSTYHRFQQHYRGFTGPYRHIYAQQQWAADQSAFNKWPIHPVNKSYVVSKKTNTPPWKGQRRIIFMRRIFSILPYAPGVLWIDLWTDDRTSSNNSREVLDTKVMWVCSGERLLPHFCPYSLPLARTSSSLAYTGESFRCFCLHFISDHHALRADRRCGNGCK